MDPASADTVGAQPRASNGRICCEAISLRVSSPGCGGLARSCSADLLAQVEAIIGSLTVTDTRPLFKCVAPGR